MTHQYLKQILVISVLVITGCQSTKTHWPEMKGLVLDKGSNEPIVDAFVIALWEGNAGSSIGGGSRICFHVATTKTDSKGKYYFPEWTNEGKWKVATSQEIRIIAYKPGYGRSELSGRDIMHMEPLNASEKEILEFLQMTMRRTSCGSGGYSRRSLYEFNRQLHDDAQALPFAHKKSTGHDRRSISTLDSFKKIAANNAIAVNEDDRPYDKLVEDANAFIEENFP